jgi:streptogramin lyase
MGTAELSRPVGVAVDAHDNVFVAELGNSSIRMIDVCGNISTLAGNGVPGFADGTGGARGTAELFEPYGVAVGPVGALYVADFRNNRIRLLQLPPLTGEPM